MRALVNGQVMMIQMNLHDALSMMPQKCYTEYVNSPLDATIGQSHIHLAAAKGQAASLETWPQCAADIDILDDEGDSALHFAAGWGRID
jgi:ankyrin repeat protein